MRFIFAFIFCWTTAFTQSISGTIRNEKNKAVSFANILIKELNSDKIVTHSSADEQGNYLITRPKKGVKMVFSAMGYASKTITVNATTNKQNVVLTEQEITLKEVVIKTENNNNTLIYQTKELLKGNEHVIEDLLKNVPGINIDKNGTIKVGNKEIEKIMVEGDDFFDKGYKLLSKNMPTDPIKEVEVLRNYSNNKLLKGIENSEKVAINLKLKEESKRIWFGNISLGYGVATKNQYIAKGNLMNFGLKTKVYVLGNLNNIGLNPIGEIKAIIEPFKFNEPALIGINQHAFELLQPMKINTEFNKSRVNFNNQETISPNLIFNVSDKLKLKALSFFNFDEKSLFKNSIENYNFSGNKFTNKKQQNVTEKMRTAFGKFVAIYTISPKKILDFHTAYSHDNNKNTNDILFNTIENKDILTTQKYAFNQKITYSQRFKNKNALLVSARFINENKPQIKNSNSYFFEELFGIPSTKEVIQKSENKLLFLGFEGHLFKKYKKGKLIELKVGNTSRIDNLNSTFSLVNSNSVLNPSDFQNKIELKNNDIYFKTKYEIKKQNKFLSFGFDLHHFNTILKNEFSEQIFALNSNVAIGYTFNKSGFALYLSHFTKPTDITNLYPNYIETSSRYFTKGMQTKPFLKTSNIGFQYNLGKYMDDINTELSVDYTHNHNFITTNMTINPEFQIINKILLKDKGGLKLGIKSNFYIELLKTNFRLNNNYFTTNFRNSINGNQRNMHYKNYQNELEIHSGFSGVFNYSIGFTANNYEIQQDTRTIKYANYNSFLDCSFILPKKFTVSTVIENYHFKDTNNYWFFDLNLNYKIPKHKIELFLKGKNLFNIKKYTDFTINNYANLSTSYGILPRSILFEIKYRF